MDRNLRTSSGSAYSTRNKTSTTGRQDVKTLFRHSVVFPVEGAEQKVFGGNAPAAVGDPHEHVRACRHGRVPTCARRADSGARRSALPPAEQPRADRGGPTSPAAAFEEGEAVDDEAGAKAEAAAS